MKRILLIGVMLAVLVLTIPVGVAATDCCECEGCCKELCCAEQTYWFKISYFERVATGYFFHGIEMTSGNWTYQYVEAPDRNEAAEMLGFEAGYGCVISRAIGYKG